ncbi:MAG: glycosyltransferase family 2 protein [Treponema sp.]|nr:glycosyltransferase family 2 protein [Treponema sp.]
MQLSIIVVSYNEADYLPECFESILKQNLDFDYEVIVGDDGSSDNSLEVIKKYEKKFKHFSYFVQERAPGLTKKDVIASIRASNVVFKAMSMAKGKYLNLVSGDDYFVDMDYFKRATYFLENNKSYSAYLTSFYCVYPDGTKEFNDIRTTARFSFWHQQYIHCSCFVFRKLPQNMLLRSFCDDCGLQYSIALNGKLKYVNECTFAYRQREKSIMHSDDREGLDIVEMLLFQDVLNKRLTSIKSIYAFLNLYIINFKHFKGPFKSLYNNRAKLNAQKYKKYTDFSCQHKNDVVSALLRPNELRNKLLLNKIRLWMKISDFVLKNAAFDYTPLAPVAMPDLPVSKAAVFYSIDSLKKTKKGVVVQGWAFVPNVATEVYIKANNKVYKPFVYSRADVEDAYKCKCINAGFLAFIEDCFDNFELCLIDREKKCVYCENVDNILTEYVPSEVVSDIGEFTEKPFPFTVDEKKFKHGKTCLRGWAYYENDDCEVFIEANGRFYNTHLVRRPDVMRVFMLDNDKHGFTAKLPFKVSSFNLCLVNHTKNEVYKTFIQG